MLFLLLLITQICSAQGVWYKSGYNMPENRYFQTVNQLAGKIYVVGGLNTELGAPPKTVLVLDVLSGVWSQIPLFNNKSIYGHCSSIVNGKLYIIGGNDSSNSTLSTVEMFDPDSDKWVSKNAMPTDRAFAACAAIGTNIYVIGGGRGVNGNYDFSGLTTLEVYNTTNNTWTRLADMPAKRWGHSAIAINGKIYVVGGVTFGAVSTVYASVEVYDTLTNTWSTKSSMPTPRYNLTSFLLNGSIYAIGGWLNSDVGPIYDKVEAYNPVTDVWRTATPLPVKCAGLAGIVSGGQINVFGGTLVNHPLIGTTDIYAISFNDLLAQNPYVDKLYARENIDSVLIRTRFYNYQNYEFTAHLICSNTAGRQIDTLTLFDDGLHGDSLPNDGLYGAYIPPRHTKDFFTVGIYTIDNQDSTNNYTFDCCRFTTAGPLKVDSIWSFNLLSAKRYAFKVSLLNQDNIFEFNNVSLKLNCGDPWVRSIVGAAENFPSIQPGTIVQTDQNTGIYYDSTFPGYFNLKFDISVDGWTYWKDSLVFSAVTGIKNIVSIPAEYVLSQNYPNPFNPTTRINYSLPRAGNVKLTVYNAIGSKVTTIVNEYKTAGNYSVNFNGSNLASGIYLYKLELGSYSATKKLILLK